ncbi:hypothetical protein O1157_27945 [Streptomyces albogriseolus]
MGRTDPRLLGQVGDDDGDLPGQWPLRGPGEVGDGLRRDRRVGRQQVDQPPPPLLQFTGGVQPGLGVPGGGRGGHLVEVQEYGLAQRDEHVRRQPVDLEEFAHPAPGHPGADPQRRLERVETAPLVGLALPDPPVRGPDVLPVGPGARQTGEEAFQGLRHTPFDDVRVRLVRGAGVLGDLDADGPDDLLGDLVEERAQVVQEFGWQGGERRVTAGRSGPGAGSVGHGAPSVWGTSGARAPYRPVGARTCRRRAGSRRGVCH